MVKEVKRSSSRWIKTRSPEHSDFAWQNGYGIFSIGASQIEDVRHYIATQEQHHAKTTFQDEFRRLLQRYQVPFDERYVWDLGRRERYNSFRVGNPLRREPG